MFNASNSTTSDGEQAPRRGLNLNPEGGARRIRCDASSAASETPPEKRISDDAPPGPE